MTEENKDDTSFLEFEAKVPAQTSNKDLWLFLIIADVIFLCIFGVFLCKDLSGHLFSSEATANNVLAEQPVSDNLPIEEIEVSAVIEQELAPAAPIVVEEVVPVAEVKEEPAVVASQPSQLEVSAATVEKKENILVKTNPKSKYRQVTFRYYGEGNEVAVVSGFTMAKPRALKKHNGYWEITLSIAPGTYKYLYVVDGQQTLDPYAETKDGRSILVLE